MGKFLSIIVWFLTITLLVVCPNANSNNYNCTYVYYGIYKQLQDMRTVTMSPTTIITSRVVITLNGTIATTHTSLTIAHIETITTKIFYLHRRLLGQHLWLQQRIQLQHHIRLLQRTYNYVGCSNHMWCSSHIRCCNSRRYCPKAEGVIKIFVSVALVRTNCNNCTRCCRRRVLLLLQQFCSQL